MNLNLLPGEAMEIGPVQDHGLIVAQQSVIKDYRDRADQLERLANDLDTRVYGGYGTVLMKTVDHYRDFADSLQEAVQAIQAMSVAAVTPMVTGKGHYGNSDALTVTEAVTLLGEIADRPGHDAEMGHVDADAVLLRLIDNDEINTAYHRIEKWYA